MHTLNSQCARVDDDLATLTCALAWHQIVEGILADAIRFASGPRYARLRDLLAQATIETRAVAERLRCEETFLLGWQDVSVALKHSVPHAIVR